MGINFGGVLYDWNSGSTIALFVVSGILFIVFALQQIFTIYTTEDDRVFPVHLVLRKEPVLLFVAGSSGGAAIYIPLYYIPIYFQFTRGDSAIQAAVRLLPFVFILSTMVMVNGYFMARFGRYTPWYLVGSTAILIGSVLMCRLFQGVVSLLNLEVDGQSSQNRCQYVHVSDIRLRGLDCFRYRLVCSGWICHYSDHRNTGRNVVWHHPHVGWYVLKYFQLLRPSLYFGIKC